MITIYNQNKIEIEILKKMEVFTKEVFEYYNGIINTISSKYMNLEITNYDCNINMNKNIFGYCKPNTITINLSKLIRFFMCSYDILYDYNSKLRYINIIKINILYIIIHELYHSDQIIDVNKYTIDNEYKNYIENQCNLFTYNYISSNIKEIENKFNIRINLSLLYDYIFENNIIDSNIDYNNDCKITNINQKIILTYINLSTVYYEIIVNKFVNKTITDYNGIIEEALDIILSYPNIIFNCIYNNMNKEIIIKKNNIINTECINDLFYYSLLNKLIVWNKSNTEYKQDTIISNTYFVKDNKLAEFPDNYKMKLCRFLKEE